MYKRINCVNEIKKWLKCMDKNESKWQAIVQIKMMQIK